MNLILFPEQRTWLHERIALRFEQMLNQDFVGEVAQLLQKWQLPPTSPSMRCVGYRQVINYLAGDYDYETLRHKGIVATRQLAKRQLTWLRSWPKGVFFNCQNPATTRREIMALVKEIMDNRIHNFKTV